MNNITSKINEIFKLYPEYFEKENFIQKVSYCLNYYDIMSLGYILMPKFFIYKNYILSCLNNEVDDVELYEYRPRKLTEEIIQKWKKRYFKMGVNFEVDRLKEIEKIYKNIEAYNNLIELSQIIYGSRNKNCNDCLPYNNKEHLKIIFKNLRNIIKYYWNIKLKINFPYRNVSAHILHDEYLIENEEDYYITLWQQNGKKLNQKLKNTFIKTEIDELFNKTIFLFKHDSAEDLYLGFVAALGGFSIFSALGLLIPEIIEYEGYIFLREKVEKYKKIKFKGEGFDYKYIRTGEFKINYKYNSSKKEIEQYNNLLNIEYYLKIEREYKYVKENYNEYLENIKKFGRMLKFFWEIRLKDLFPDKKFKVEILDSPFEQKGLCITFWEDTK